MGNDHKFNGYDDMMASWEMTTAGPEKMIRVMPWTCNSDPKMWLSGYYQRIGYPLVN